MELSREIGHVKKISLQSEDSYIRALGANILFLAHDGKNALSLASGLATSQEKNGAVGGGKTTITCSGGDSLKIETTSLAVLAWLRIDGRFAPNVESAMKWLFERCKSGRFGSTQSTILALKAINAYDKARAVPKNPGSVRLVVDGRPFGNPVSFTKESKGTIELPDFSIAMTPGTHTVGLVMEDGSEMPFTLEVSCNTKLPVSAPDCAVKVETALSGRNGKGGGDCGAECDGAQRRQGCFDAACRDWNSRRIRGALRSTQRTCERQAHCRVGDVRRRAGSLLARSACG